MSKNRIMLLGISLIVFSARAGLAAEVLPDYLEPNGPASEYALLTPGSTIDLTLHSSLDEDYFHLLFPGVDGTVLLQIDYAGADGDLALQHGSDGYWSTSEILGSAGHLSASWPTDPFGQDDLRIFSPTGAAIADYDIDFSVLYPDLAVEASYLPGQYLPDSTLKIDASLANFGGHITAETRSNLLSAAVYLRSASASPQDILLSHANGPFTGPGPWDISGNYEVQNHWQTGAYYLGVDYTDCRGGQWLSESWISAEPDILIASAVNPEPAVLALMLIGIPALLRRRSA